MKVRAGAAAASLLAIIAAAPAAHALVRVDSATFPDTFAAAGQTLTLNGVGLRVFFHIVDAYATALYVRAPARTAEAVDAAPDPKAVVTIFLHAASLAQIRDESDGIHRRFCAHVACSAIDQASYATFVSHMEPVRAGDRQTILVTDAGVTVSRNDRPVVTIPDPSFGQNLLRSLLGPAAPTARYRNGLLGVSG